MVGLKEIDILSVRIDNISQREIMERIVYFLNEPRFHQISTVNPEFILEAQKNSPFRNILNNSDLNIADGVGIWFAFIWNLRYLKARIAGADLMMEILRYADEKKIGLFLACNKNGLSSFEKTREAILKMYPKLDIYGDNIDMQDIPYEIPNTEYKILFCNFGAPHQEIFINSIKSDRIRLAMGVGGAFDFLTEKMLRAPKIMRKTGLEWLWRIIQPQPWKYKKERIKRIIRAVLFFPLKVIFE